MFAVLNAVLFSTDGGHIQFSTFKLTVTIRLLPLLPMAFGAFRFIALYCIALVYKHCFHSRLCG